MKYYVELDIKQDVKYEDEVKVLKAILKQVSSIEWEDGSIDIEFKPEDCRVKVDNKDYDFNFGMITEQIF